MKPGPAILALLLAALAAQPSPVRQIVMDGEFLDWEALPVAVRDPADARSATLDFGEVRLTADDRFVYGFVDCRRVVNIDDLGGAATVSVLLDADNNPGTGRLLFGLNGVDMAIELSPPQAAGSVIHRFPARAGEPTASSPNAIGMRLAPGYAAAQFEFRIDRGIAGADAAQPPLLVADRAVVKLVLEENSVAERVYGAGTVSDETAATTFGLPPFASPAPLRADDRVPSTDPLQRATGTALRAAVWNVAHFEEKARDRAFQVLRAIDADILLLDELEDDAVGALETRLKDRVTRPAWRLAAGHGTGVAVGGSVAPVIEKVPYPAESLDAVLEAVVAGAPAERRAEERALLEARGVTANGAAGTIGDRRIFAVALGLQCCGGSAREARRMIEVRAIDRAVRAALPQAKANAVLIGGDFNLVWTRDPLEVLTRGLDRDGSDLGIVQAHTLDGRSTETWRSPSGPFVPGRLDWLLYSNSSLAVVNAFVFDSNDLSPYWLAQHGLRRDDSSLTSDHLPVVADFRWR